MLEKLSIFLGYSGGKNIYFAWVYCFCFKYLHIFKIPKSHKSWFNELWFNKSQLNESRFSEQMCESFSIFDLANYTPFSRINYAQYIRTYYSRGHAGCYVVPDGMNPRQKHSFTTCRNWKWNSNVSFLFFWQPDLIS